jgi:hypothetical protein
VRPLEKRGFSPNYSFGFYLSNPDSNSLQTYHYSSNTYYLDKSRTKINNDILEATGLFASKLDGPKVGIWIMKYDFKQKIKYLDTIEYFNKATKSLPTNGFYTSIMRNSRMENFYLDYFIKLNEDERVIVTEQFFLLPASIGSSYNYNRFYGDILVLFMNKHGEINYTNRIIKAQQTYNNFGEFSSYFIERKDSILQFYYNDHFKNSEIYNYKHLVWHKHSHLALTEVSKHGKIKFSLANFKDIDGIIQVSDMLRISPNTYLVYAFKNKRSKLGKMTITR